MENHFAGIVGWEKFAGQWYLRMKLAEPHVKHVWPGSPSERAPEGEMRRLIDEVLTADDVRSVINNRREAAQRGYSTADMRLLWRAMESCPLRHRGRDDDRGPKPNGPSLRPL